MVISKFKLVNNAKIKDKVVWNSDNLIELKYKDIDILISLLGNIEICLLKKGIGERLLSFEGDMNKFKKELMKFIKTQEELTELLTGIHPVYELEALSKTSFWIVNVKYQDEITSFTWFLDATSLPEAMAEVAYSIEDIYSYFKEKVLKEEVNKGEKRMSKEKMDLIKSLQFGDLVHGIIEMYKEGSDEPLDGDETERLAEIVLAEMDLIEGNITEEEYHERLERKNVVVKCPRSPFHNEFITTAHEVHDWVVDGEGNFLEDLGCSEVAAYPDVNNTWTCKICGAKAVVL